MTNWFLGWKWISIKELKTIQAVKAAKPAEVKAK